MADFLDSLKIGYGYEDEIVAYTMQLSRKYRPDFNLMKKDQTIMHVEIKGWFRSQDRTKYLAVKASNPTLDLRFVFERDNPLYPGSKTKYSDWATTHGFKFHVGEGIPEHWIKELA